MTYSSYVAGQFSLRDEVKPIAAGRNSMIQHVNQLFANGGTPTQSAMYEAMRYFRGESPRAMGGIRSSGPPEVVGSCQSNHIVLLTDGEPYPRNYLPEIGRYIGSNCATNRGNNPVRGNCGIELAQFMQENDHYPNVPGLNSISTHTIGLSLDMQWLDDMATAGGGGYYSVGTSDQLLTAFESIMEAAFDQTNTFVAPSISVDQFTRLSHRDEAFLALFQPTQNIRWPGNLKRYKLAGSPTAILDKNGTKAMEGGTFKDSAHSFWSDERDGANVAQGGAASKLDIATRKVTTYTNSGSNYLLNEKNLVHEDNHARISQWTNSSGESLKRLLAWARGVDIDDDDDDQSTADTRQHIGSPLHSTPAIVNYGGTSDEPDSVIFFGTNEGYLHAISSIDGTELYSFIPPELLNNLEAYYNNETSRERPHGLDGSLTVWMNDDNGNGIVDPDTDTTYLYIGMRRGGNNYYALDVTDKENPQYLWTISGGSGDFSKLGQSWSKPVKSKIAIDGTTKDVLIFGGGYDPSQDTKKGRSRDTIGNTFYIVDATDGSLIWKTDMDNNSDYTNMRYSIPSDLRVLDLDGNGLADQIYFGDMGGQLWRFDIDPTASTASNLIKGGMIADLADSGAKNNRRFFYPPDVALVSHENEVFLSIAIGSGHRANPLDRNIDDRFYMIRQSEYRTAPDGYGFQTSPATNSASASYRPIIESDLYDATANNVQSSDTDVALEANEDLMEAQGWYLELNKLGEKVLGTSVTIDNKIVFASYIPRTGDDICSPSAGTNRAYIVNLFDATPIEGTDPNDRWRGLKTEGIAGSVTAFIKETGNGQTGTDKGPSVVPVVGLEPIEFPGINVIRRTYWSEYPNF